MKAQLIEYKGFNARILLVGFLSALLLTAYAPVTTSTPPQPLPMAAENPEAAPAPVILRVVDREETKGGFLYLYQEIYFTDPDGDAASITYKMISSSLSYPILLPDDPIETSAEEQKGEALFTVGGRCREKMELVIESRIRDEFGNLSEPVTFHMSCTTPPIVDLKPILISGLVTAFPIAVLLGLESWLLFRKHPKERLPAVQSTLLFTSMLFVMQFAGMILHEGGHALYLLVKGVPITLYVHPFAFSGYFRPLIDSSIWKDILGSAVAIPVAMLISLPFWKRRSLGFLSLIVIGPYVLQLNGMYMLSLTGDFQNIMQITGVPAIVLIFIGALFALTGILLLFSLFPLFGLSPRDRKSLFVIPSALLLWGFLSMIVACLVVPGSPINQDYFLAPEIFSSFYVNVLMWAILFVLYLVPYRWVYPILPAWLQTQSISLTWKDLQIPALLSVISVVLGLAIIS